MGSPLGRIVAACFAAAASLTALVSTGCRRSAPPPVKTHEPAPAGGAGPDDDDAGDALVEDARTYEVKAWTFPLERFELRIEDAEMSTAFDRILERTGAELVVNGGFFDAAKKPLGLAISNGVVLSKHTTALSGGIMTVDGGTARLWEAETFDAGVGPKFAIQCRPRLVVDGAPNVKSDDGKRSERTALCLREGGRTVDVVIVRGAPREATGPSLYALGRYLAKHGCESALNLDGGPSTGVAWMEEGKAQLIAPRGPVRHVIAFKKR